jgi:hypothetical protein
MFDNLRDDSSSSFYENDEAAFQSAGSTAGTYTPARSGSKRFLGMTSLQRFVITFMLMLAVCILGAMFLLAMGKIGI